MASIRLTSSEIHLKSSNLSIDILWTELQEGCQELHRIVHRLCGGSELESIRVIILLLPISIALLHNLIWLVLLRKCLAFSFLCFFSRFLRSLFALCGIFSI